MHVASSSRPRLPQSAEKALLRRPFSHLQRTDKPRPPHPTSHHNYKTVYQPARDFATACWGNQITAPPATRQLERSCTHDRSSWRVDGGAVVELPHRKLWGRTPHPK